MIYAVNLGLLKMDGKYVVVASSTPLMSAAPVVLTEPKDTPEEALQALAVKTGG